MGTPIYIGDEVTAAGFRLAGLRTKVPAENEVVAAVDWAMEQTSLVLISPTIHDRLPVAVREACLTSISPAVVVIPDIRHGQSMPDLSTEIRRQLGVHE